MTRLIVSLLIEAAIGLSLAAVVLGLGLPPLIRYKLIAPGDLAGAIVIGIVIVCAIAGVVFRPGSALNRYAK